MSRPSGWAWANSKLEAVRRTRRGKPIKVDGIPAPPGEVLSVSSVTLAQVERSSAAETGRHAMQAMAKTARKTAEKDLFSICIGDARMRCRNRPLSEEHRR